MSLVRKCMRCGKKHPRFDMVSVKALGLPQFMCSDCYDKQQKDDDRYRQALQAGRTECNLCHEKYPEDGMVKVSDGALTVYVCQTCVRPIQADMSGYQAGSIFPDRMDTYVHRPITTDILGAGDPKADLDKVLELYRQNPAPVSPPLGRQQPSVSPNPTGWTPPIMPQPEGGPLPSLPKATPPGLDPMSVMQQSAERYLRALNQTREQMAELLHKHNTLLDRLRRMGLDSLIDSDAPVLEQPTDPTEAPATKRANPLKQRRRQE